MFAPGFDVRLASTGPGLWLPAALGWEESQGPGRPGLRFEIELGDVSSFLFFSPGRGSEKDELLGFSCHTEKWMGEYNHHDLPDVHPNQPSFE